MEKTSVQWERDGFLLRPARREDAEDYCRGFLPLDPEAARLTGSREQFTREEVLNFFLRCREDGDRFDFLLLSPEGEVIGESVLNEIDRDCRSANFRIGIFRPGFRGKGIGTWMVRCTRDFAFEQLGLHRVSLDVFSFNPRAERAYLAAGFRREGVLREAVATAEGWADDILMAILEEEWREQKAREENTETMGR